MLPDPAAVRAYLLRLQDGICAGLEAEDGGQGGFRTDEWVRPEGGGGRTRLLAEGEVFEKAGVAFSHVRGERLPASATAHRPELAGRPWEALGVSLVIYPRNPQVFRRRLRPHPVLRPRGGRGPLAPHRARRGGPVR